MWVGLFCPAQHVFHYKAAADLPQAAATCGFGLVRDDPFSHGNKRAGFLAIVLFLDLSGWELRVDLAEAIKQFCNWQPASSVSPNWARWIQEHARRPRKS